MPLIKRFALSLYWNLLGKIFLSVIGFSISVVIARGLGKDNLGIYASLLAIPVVFRLFTSFGLETILNLKLPSLNIQEHGLEKIRFLIRRLLSIRLLTIILAMLILYYGMPLFAKIMRKPEIIKYAIPLSFYFAALVSIPLISMVFQSLLKLKAVSILEGFNQLLNLILILMFFYMGYEISGVIWAFVISTGVTIIIYFFWGKEFFIGKTEQINMRESYEVGTTAFLSALFALGLGNQIDIILLNYFGVSNSDIGFYYITITLAAVFSFLVNGIGSISQSAFSESYEKNNEAGLVSSWGGVVRVCFFLTAPMYIFAFIHAKPIVIQLYGNQYAGAILLFQVWMFFSLARILSGAILCAPIFYILKKKKTYLKFLFFAGVLNIVLDVLLIPRMGVLGAVLATTLSMVISALIELLYVLRLIKIAVPIKFEIKILLASILALIPTLGWETGSIFILIIKGLIYGLFLVLFMLIIKPLNDDKIELLKEVDYRIYYVAKYF